MTEITNIRLVISQPPTGKTPSEYDMPANDLDIFEKHAAERAFHTMNVWKKEKPEAYEHHLRPGEVQCAYCKAKADCPALARMVGETTFGVVGLLDGTETNVEDPNELPHTRIPIEPNLLAAYYLRIPLIQKWCEAVAASVFAKMKSGEIGAAQGLKFVAGKKGNRAWDNAEVVEALFKEMRIPKDDMYTYKLVTPAQAEKVMAESPRRWKKLEPHIQQADGAPSVVHISDKRPAISLAPTAEGFTETADDLL